MMWKMMLMMRVTEIGKVMTASEPGRVYFLTDDPQFVFLKLALPITVYYIDFRHLNIMQVSPPISYIDPVSYTHLTLPTILLV